MMALVIVVPMLPSRLIRTIHLVEGNCGQWTWPTGQSLETAAIDDYSYSSKHTFLLYSFNADIRIIEAC